MTTESSAWQRPRDILAIKVMVRERDGYRCTKCGLTDGDHRDRYGKALDVHRTTPGSAYTVAGCVTLCRECHGPEAKLPRGTCRPRRPGVVLVAWEIDKELAKELRAFAKSRGESIRSVTERAMVREMNNPPPVVVPDPPLPPPPAPKPKGRKPT